MFQSRFQDSFQIKFTTHAIIFYQSVGFNPVSRIRFKSRELVTLTVCRLSSFNPVSRIRFKSRIPVATMGHIAVLFQSRFQDSFQIKWVFCRFCVYAFVVSIPFPGFVSNQGKCTLFAVDSQNNVSIPFPGFVSNQVQFSTHTMSDSFSKFQSRFQDSFQIKVERVLNKYWYFRVSIPFPGFVSNQVKAKLGNPLSM